MYIQGSCCWTARITFGPCKTELLTVPKTSKEPQRKRERVSSHDLYRSDFHIVHQQSRLSIARAAKQASKNARVKLTNKPSQGKVCQSKSGGPEINLNKSIARKTAGSFSSFSYGPVRLAKDTIAVALTMIGTFADREIDETANVRLKITSPPADRTSPRHAASLTL